MKEKSKKIISIAIVLFMVLNYFVPVINYAEDNTNEGIKQQTETEEIGREYEIKETEEWDISEKQDKSVIAKWNLADKSITISGKGKMKHWQYDSTEDWNIKYKKIIEKVIINNGITNIGNFAFDECSSLEEIAIPSSVTSIGWNAFDECSSLEKIKVSSENKNYISVEGVLYNKDVTEIIKYPANKLGEKYSIPDSVTSIGEDAFNGCSNLKEIIIPSSVIKIAYQTFCECSSLEKIVIPEGVTKIAQCAFKGCSSLKEIAIPSTVISIESYSFEDCNSLEEITIPNGVTSIGRWAFSRCSSLKEITIPEGVTSIGGDAFSGCSSLKEITIPEGVTSIGGNAFSGCSSLKEITIPSSITCIGDYAFKGCSSSEEITIPNSVTSIGKYAFSGCKYIICKTNSYAHKYAEENRISYKLTDNEISKYPDLYEIKETEEWDISVKQDKSVIAKWNLADKSITISGIGNMKSWWDYYNGFKIDEHKKYRKVVKKTVINDGITNIGEYAFNGCSSLEEITIPNSVTSIESFAFKGCSSLKEITIPSSVKFIAGGVFEQCGSLEKIKISSENTNFTSVDGVLYNKHKTKIIVYPANKSGEKYSIPDGVTSIGSSAFSGCSSLEEITIPSGVTSIGTGAFDGCSSLEEITIPNSVTSIGEKVFYRCSSLKEITIPNSVISIGRSAFDGCSSLKEITIPSGVTRIQSDAFSGCSSLKEITIPNSVTSIGSSAFDGCSSLEEIIIPSGVTSIGTCAFFGCSSLEEITIPNSVTSIGNDAFYKVRYRICKTNSYAHKYVEENKVPYILDDKPPEIKVEYSITKLTNKNVTATITSNEKLQEVVGWTLSEDKKTLTNEYEQNAEEEIIVKDLVGNEAKQTIKITNIVQATGDVTQDGVVNIGDLLKLKQHIAYEQSETTKTNHPNWKLDEEKVLIGDVNKNGKIDIGDVLKIRRYIAASTSKEIAEKHSDWLNLK